MAKVCFVSIDVEPDFSQLGFNTGERSGFEGVERLDNILDIFQRVGVKATLFTTGQVLEKYPDKARQWADDFEIASHSFSHRFWSRMSQNQREQDIVRFIAIYKSIFNSLPVGFRAPSHLIDESALKLLENKGFLYDSSVLPHYPFFKKYRGYCGKAPKKPYYPLTGNCRSKSGEHGQGAAAGMRILEIPVSGQILGIPLAGAWISRVPSWFYKVLFFFYSPRFICVSMHPWDALDFTGRTTKPEDFLRNLENLLNVLKKCGYQFLSSREIAKKYGKF